MTGYEQALLARAERLEDTGELVQAITAVLAGAQRAGADPATVTSLQAAARTLDPGADTGYDAGSKDDRRRGTGYRSDGEFLEAVSSAEDDVRDRLREIEQMQEAIATSMDAVQAALDAAYAMPVNDECDGCHGAKETAIQAALGRIRLCEAAGGILDPLTERLQPALARLRQIPEDLGEVYELVYALHSQGRQAARLRPVDRRGRSAHVRVGSGRGATLRQRITDRLARGVRADQRGRGGSAEPCVTCFASHASANVSQHTVMSESLYIMSR
jgi:hypothetical protein